jgi:hypothetical protein
VKVYAGSRQGPRSGARAGEKGRGGEGERERERGGELTSGIQIRR